METACGRGRECEHAHEYEHEYEHECGQHDNEYEDKVGPDIAGGGAMGVGGGPTCGGIAADGLVAIATHKLHSKQWPSPRSEP